MKKVIFLIGTSGSFGSWSAGETAEIAEHIAKGFVEHGNAKYAETAIKQQQTPQTATKK